MEHTSARIAEVALRLKHQYKAVLGASPTFGQDAKMTREMDRLGQLIKELEDEVIILQIKVGELAEQPGKDELK